MLRKKIDYEKKRVRYFKRKKNESTLSRFLQFNLPYVSTKMERTIADPLNKRRITEAVCNPPDETIKWTEPEWKANKIEYLKCQVMKSGTGHYIIFNSTEDMNEFWLIHPSTSYILFRKKGCKVERVEKIKKEYTKEEYYEYVGKDKIKLVLGSEKIEIKNDKKEHVDKNVKIYIDLDEFKKVGKNCTIQIGENLTITVGKNISIKAGESIVIESKKITLKAKDINLDGEVHVSKNVRVKKDVYAKDCHCD